MTPTKPKRCIRCKREIANVTTDGIELYVAGVAMPPPPPPLKLIGSRFHCTHKGCDGYFNWIEPRHKTTSSSAKIVIEHNPQLC